MPTERQVKDFMIEYAIKSVLESSRCEVKHGRSIEDFIEYAKWVPLEHAEDTSQKGVDFRTMIIDYFTSDKEHYFEIKRKIEKRKAELKELNATAV